MLGIYKATLSRFWSDFICIIFYTSHFSGKNLLNSWYPEGTLPAHFWACQEAVQREAILNTAKMKLQSDIEMPTAKELGPGSARTGIASEMELHKSITFQYVWNPSFLMFKAIFWNIKEGLIFIER